MTVKHKLRFTSDLRRRLRMALREDLERGDVTSRLTVDSSARGEAVIRAKQDGVLAGAAVVKEIFRLVDPRLRISLKQKDGTRVKKGAVVCVIRGRVRSILAGERTALNFLQHLSGVATATRAFADRVGGGGVTFGQAPVGRSVGRHCAVGAVTFGQAAVGAVKIYDTRKTTPLWRDLEKYAVRAGGGYNHRFSLGEAVMIKDTHWVAMSLRAPQGRSNLRADLRLLRRAFGAPRNDDARQAHVKLMPVIVEIHSMRQLPQALRMNPSVIMFDNWPPQKLREGVRYVKNWSRHTKAKPPEIEASGGVTLENAGCIARAGVDRISVGAITHSAPALDFSLTIERMKT